MAEEQSMRGQVAAVSKSGAKHERKLNVDCLLLKQDWGVEGDAHAGPGHRQVSLLAQESIVKMQKLGLDVKPGDFAENITTTGLDLSRLRVGDQVLIGDAVLEITQLGKECHARCEIYRQAGDCVMPREGVFARVLSGGLIRPGDAVVIRPAGGAAPEVQRDLR